MTRQRHTVTAHDSDCTSSLTTSLLTSSALRLPALLVWPQSGVPLLCAAQPSLQLTQHSRAARRAAKLRAAKPRPAQPRRRMRARACVPVR